MTTLALAAVAWTDNCGSPWGTNSSVVMPLPASVGVLTANVIVGTLGTVTFSVAPAHWRQPDCSLFSCACAAAASTYAETVGATETALNGSRESSNTGR